MAENGRSEPFSVGDAVQRPKNIYAESGLQRRGIVTRRYADEHDDELYEVEWQTEGGKPLDPPHVLKGYFRWGLDGPVVTAPCSENP